MNKIIKAILTMYIPIIFLVNTLIGLALYNQFHFKQDLKKTIFFLILTIISLILWIIYLKKIKKENEQ